MSKQALRLRFNLRDLLRLIAAWAVPNALVKWTMNSGFIVGTPEQISQWTLYAIICVNFMVCFFVVYIYALTWLNGAMRPLRTDAEILMPSRIATRPKNARTIICMTCFVLWCIAARALERVLAKTFSLYVLMPYNLRYMMILSAPLLPLSIRAILRNQHIAGEIWQSWSSASSSERLCRSLGLLWSLTAILVLAIRPRIVFWGTTPWFPIPTVTLVMAIGQLGGSPK